MPGAPTTALDVSRGDTGRPEAPHSSVNGQRFTAQITARKMPATRARPPTSSHGRFKIDSFGFGLGALGGEH